MKKLWNLTNRVDLFLTINIISWTVGTMILGLAFCAVTGMSIGESIVNLMCAAIYVGIIMGLFGGILFLMRRES